MSSFNEIIGIGDHSENANLAGDYLFNDDAASTAVVDRSSNGNDMTLYGGENTSDKSVTGPNSYLTKALQLITNDYIQTGSALVSGVPSTIACWIKSPTISGGGDGRIAGHYVGTNVAVLGGYNSDFSNVFVAQHYDGSQAVATGTTAPADTWRHVVFRFSSNSLRSIWVNGVKEAEDTTAQGSIGTIDNFIVGRSPWSGGGQYLDADMAGLSVWSDALTDAEIAELAGGPELNYVSGASFGPDGAFNGGTYALPAPYASGSNGTPTYSFIAVKADGTVLDSASTLTGTLDLSANAGNTCYLLGKAENDGGSDIGDFATRTSGYGSSGDGYYEIASVTAAGGGGGSIIKQVMHHRRLMGVS